MHTAHKITLEIPDEVFAEIEEFRKTANMANAESAMIRLIKYALSLPEYFKGFDWLKAEKEADEDIASGRIMTFASVDEFLADLNA
jgi:hypothetical protein